MTVSINGMAEAFRAQLDAPGPIELPGCHDSLSAMIIEEVGFRSVFLSGYGVAASLMGSGVGKSGSPTPNEMIGCPAALSVFARASNAMDADAEILAARVLTRPRVRRLT